MILDKKFRRNLLILLAVFALFIISILSFIDMKRMDKQLNEDYIERINLAEMNIRTALKQWNTEYMQLDGQIAAKMKESSEILLKQYEQNPQFDSWNFDELKEQFGMDVYIINEENEVIYSSYKPDIELNFSECCLPFAKLLTERRKNGEFVHDVIDLQKDVGELKKFSYIPTNDGKYLIELSYEIEKDPKFLNFAFVTVMNDLKMNYPFIKSISIFNEDYYKLNYDKIESLRSHEQTSDYFEWINNSTSIKDNNYMFIKTPNFESFDKPIIKVVEIAYDNSNLDKALKESKGIFYIQLFGTFLLAIVIIIFIYKIIEKPMYLAFHDRLTGLKNRAAFENEVQRLIEKEHTNFGFLLLDFDNFKVVNDTLGHHNGDLLLKFIADLIKTKLPQNAFFARFGGDEFIILIKDLQHPKEMEHLANELIQSFKEIQNEKDCCELFNKGVQIVSDCNVTLSIGSSLYPKDGKDGETLYRKADIALYYSKEHGKSRYTYFTEGLG